MNGAELASLGISIDSTQVNTANRNLDKLNKTAKESVKATDALAGAAKLATAALATVGLTSGLNRTINTIVSFENELSSLRAVSNATQQQMASLEKQARELGATTQYGANQAAEAQKYLAQAGLEVNQTLGATPKVLQLAQAGMLGLGEASDLATDIMSQMSLEIEDLGHLNDVLVKTANSATTNVRQLGGAFSYAGPVAASFGLSLETTASALGLISNAGIKAERAGTGLRGMLNQLSKVTNEGERTLAKYGITLDQIDVSARGFTNVIDTLATKNIEAADMVQLFGAESASAALAVIRNSEALADNADMLEKVEGEAAKVALVMTDNIGGAFKSFNSAIEESMLQIGDAGLTGSLKELTVTTTGVINSYNGMLDQFGEANGLSETQISRIEVLAQGIKTLTFSVGTFTGVLATYTAGAYAAAAAQRVFNAAVRANPYVAAATLLATAVAALYSFKNATVEVGNTTTTVGRYLQETWQVVTKNISEWFSNTGEILSNTFSGFVNFFRENSEAIYSAWRAYIGAMTEIWKTVVNTILNLFLSLSNSLYSIITGIYDNFVNMFKGILNTGKAFWSDFTGIFEGDFDFSVTANAIKNGIEPIRNIPAEVYQAFEENLGVDRIGNIAESFSKLADEVESSIERSQIKLGVLDDWLLTVDETSSNTKDEISELNDTLNDNSKESENTAKKLKEFNDTLLGLLDRLNPIQKAQREFMQDQIMLQTALFNGSLSIEDYFNNLEKLEGLYQSTTDFADIYFSKANEGAKKATEVADPMADAWTQAAKRIDESFAKAFKGAFDSFEDFSSSLLNSFKTLLAELAYQATLKPIVINFTQSAQSAFGIGQNGSGANGGFGNIGDIASTVKNSISDGFNSINWTGGPSSYGGGGWANSATSGAGRGFMGGSTGNFSGTTGLASMGAGLGGSWLGGELFGDSQMGGTLSTLGGAAGTFFGGPVGAAAGSFLGQGLGSLLDSVFGFGSHTKFNGRFGTTDTLDSSEYYGRPSNREVFEHQNNDHEQFYAQSKLGYTGFLNAGTRRLQRAGMGDDKGWAQQLAKATAQIDNAVAAFADGGKELQHMRDVVQGMQIDTGDAERIVKFALDERPRAALQSIASDFSQQLMDRVGTITKENAEKQINQLITAFNIGEQINGMTVNVRNYAEQVINSGKELSEAFEEIKQGIAAHSGVSEIADQLNLQFSSLADGAVEAANNLVKLSGGLDSLNSKAQSFYQNFYSERERENRLISQITPILNEVGLSVDSTKMEFRSLVESLDLNTESGSKTYSQLMDIADAFAKISGPIDNSIVKLEKLEDTLKQQVSTLEDDVKRIYESFKNTSFDQQITLLQLAGREQDAVKLQRENELKSIEESLRPFQERIWALQDEQKELDKAKKASSDYQEALKSANNFIKDFNSNIEQAVTRIRAENMGTSVNSKVSKSFFDSQYQKALDGDRGAVNSIASVAKDYIKDAQANASTLEESQFTALRVAAQLEKLPKMLTSEEFITKEIKEALTEQSKFISKEITKALKTDNPEMIASSLSKYFDILASGIDGVLTSEQLSLVMEGKATDNQIESMMRMIDLNGDRVVSKLESVVIKSMPTDGLLANLLSNVIKETSSKQLTEYQVRKALSPIATDSQIKAFMLSADSNADDIISSQEITNVRLGGLSKGIGGALNPMFDKLDTSIDGLLNYSEFKAGFKGLASDSQLKEIFKILDSNGDGTISALEAVKHSTNNVGENTGTIEERSLEQITKLTQLTEEMIRSTDEKIGMKNTLQSLADSLKAFGLAQEELARIQKEKKDKEERDKQKLELERQLDNKISDYRGNLTGLVDKRSGYENRANSLRYDAQKYGSNLDSRDRNNIERLLEKQLDGSGNLSQSKLNNVVDHLAKTFGSKTVEYLYGRNLAYAYRNQTNANNLDSEIRNARHRLNKAIEEKNRKLDGSHASGLNRVPFDGYRAELHKNEMVVTAEDAPSVRGFLNNSNSNYENSEMGLNQTQNSNYAQLQELRNLRMELKELKEQSHRDNYAIAKTNQKMQKILDRWEMDGMPETREEMGI